MHPGRRSRRYQRAGAIAVLAAVAATAFVVLNRPDPPYTLSSVPVPVVDDSDDWATRAQATIQALRIQIDIAIQAEEAWDEHHASYRDTPEPAALSALREHKALLVRQHAVLESVMATWMAIPAAAADVADYDEEIADLDEQLARPGPAEPDAEREESLRSLQQQRDAVARRRDSRRQELELLQSAAREARDRELPDARDRMSPLARQVIDAVNAASPREGTWRLLW